MAPEDPVLRVLLLGAPCQTWEGAPFEICRRQARGLLYHLAAQRAPVTRDRLCFLFWPDVPEATARCNLSRLISLLRAALPDAALLLAPGDTVALDAAHTWVDVSGFERLERGVRAGVQPDELAELVERYRGPFLNGFSVPNSEEFDTWVTLERARWERAVLEVLARLVDLEAAAGHYASAIVYARRSLEIDVLSEVMHRRVIELLAASGDRGAADRQYETLVTVLQRELGLDPLPETTEVYRAVRSGRRTAVSVPEALRDAAPNPDCDVPLAGREDAWRSLADTFAKARAGWGQAVLLTGEAGIGKSRLLREFGHAVAHRAVVLRGACHRELQTSPFQPIIEATRSGIEIGWLRDALPPHGVAELARLLPELRATHAERRPAAVGEAAWARGRLFEALEALFAQLASARPILLCLDDLQWADQTTLDWLVFFGRRLSSLPCLLLLAWRPGAVEPLVGLHETLTRSGNLCEVALSGLDEASVLEILCQVDPRFGRQPSLCKRLTAVTGGNPFFLLELARAMREGEGDFVAERVPIPKSVRSAVRARLHALNPLARQVAEAAAILGAPFALEVVRRTCARSQAEIADALDELLAQQILAPVTGGYGFRHELMREAVYADVSQHRRMLVHGRAGRVLAGLPASDPATCAWHFEQAGLPAEAAHYALLAAGAAQALYAEAEARFWSTRALTLLEEAAPRLTDPAAVVANLRARVEALTIRGWALRLTGNMEAYVDDLEQEAVLAERLDDDRALAHLRQRQAHVQNWCCRHGLALTLAEEGIQFAQVAGERLLEALCWREKGLALRGLGAHALAQEALLKTLDLLGAKGHASARVHVLGNLSTLHLLAGDLGAAAEAAGRALAVCERAHLLLERRVPLGDLGAAAAAAGDAATAAHYLHESLEIAHRASDRTQEVFCLGHLGWLDLALGRPDAALARLGEALAICERMASAGEQSWLHAGLARALLLADRRAEARVHAEHARELGEQTSRPHDQRVAADTLRLLIR